jgi:hypothetical protein
MSSIPRSRAVQLLAKVLDTPWFDRQTVADELVVSVKTLEAFLEGKLAMPLDRQLCLALFVIEKVPPLARLGYQLRGQVKAAMAFEAHATATHATSPPGAAFR